MKNRFLDEYDINDPLSQDIKDRLRDNSKYGGDNMAYKEATSGEVLKLEEGDSIEGNFINIEESKQFSSSYALRVETREGVRVTFVSGIIRDLIEANSIKKGQKIKCTFKGMKKSETTGREYKDYQLLYE